MTEGKTKKMQEKAERIRTDRKKVFVFTAIPDHVTRMLSDSERERRRRREWNRKGEQTERITRTPMDLLLGMNFCVLNFRT